MLYNGGRLALRNFICSRAYIKRCGYPQHTLIFKHHYQTRREDLDKLEERANNNPGDARVQHIFLQSVVGVDPGFVIRRVESGKFALNKEVIETYDRAREMTGSKITASDRSSTEQTQPPMLVTLIVSINNMVRKLIVFIVVPYLLYLFAKNFLQSQGGPFATKDYLATIPTQTFDDVAGNNVAKKEMQNLVSFLTEPEKFIAMGCKIPKGVLLSGPPGVGKTLLAKALAGEACVPFFFASGSEFDQMFVGMGAKRIRSLFKSAKEAAPSIIFIDEIDTVGMKRGFSGNRATINQLLAEMDGFNSQEGVVVLAATNDPDALDDALVREGRFDNKITLLAPSSKDRVNILKVHCKNKKVDPDVDLEYLAKACVGMSGAQLATLVNTAGLRAVQKKKERIDQEDITEKKIYLATIEPRGVTMGHVFSVHKQDVYSIHNDQLIANIDIGFGGRAAEEVLYKGDKGEITTGCAADMSNITRFARILVEENGYSPKQGYVRYSDSELKNIETNQMIEEEIKILLDERYKVVKEDIMKHKVQWARLRDFLIEYKTLTGEECRTIFKGGRPSRLPSEGLPSS
ncbi:hypothetical protein ACHWQZ_G019377 [Mnemiopsis leidyi]